MRATRTRSEPDRVPKKLFIKTYGCQMNVYDSARMADVLAPLGYAPTDAAEDADMVILNTCHIREKAAEKVFSELGRLKPLKARKARRGGRMIVAVAGCVAQAEGAEIVARAPHVDIVVGPQSYHRLPEMVARAARAERARARHRFPRRGEIRFPARSAGARRRLGASSPCRKAATSSAPSASCLIRAARNSRGRPRTMLAEARRLVARGAREITLLGQNVNAYHGEAPTASAWGLGRLIRALAEIAGLARIRYTTSHPRDVDDELIAAHGDVPQLMPFLHLPVQSGSDRVLAAMNRRHTRR